MKPIEEQRRIEVRCPPADVAALVLDPEVSARFDDRVAKVIRVTTSPPIDGIELTVRQRPRMPGSRLWEPPVEIHYRVSTSGSSTVVEQVLAPWPANRLNHLLGRYRAQWAWQPTVNGCRVEREVSYGLRLLPRLLVGSLLRRRLGSSLDSEMVAVKHHLESRPGSDPVKRSH